MNHPDYVFEDGYELMPLPELEAYIENNRHLPGIPAKEELAQVDIVSQQQKLLEKIEELTLYTIEQEKHINELKELLCLDHPGAALCQ